MSNLSKIISGIIVLLLLGGLIFAIFAFVDHSNKANERLSDQKQEQQDKDKKKDKDKEKKKKDTEESTQETQQTQQTQQT
ncbi:DUF4887 domain-containing protein, partial [Staphylococcus arlettae]